MKNIIILTSFLFLSSGVFSAEYMSFLINRSNGTMYLAFSNGETAEIKISKEDLGIPKNIQLPAMKN